MKETNETDKITFLGTGDSMGVPRVYCECSTCREARKTGENRRTRSSLLIRFDSSELLLDCGPDWRMQMERLGKRNIKHVLITHAHHDHIAGLPEWADACRWLESKGHVYAPKEVLDVIRQQYPWLENQLVFHTNDGGFKFHDWHIRPWKVCHGKNGEAFAYHFQKDDYRWAYCSDSINLQGEQKQPLFHLNLLILGTNFYREEAEFSTRSVYDMVEALELIREVMPGKVVFTHLSHDINKNGDYALAGNVELGHDGLAIPFINMI